MFDVADHTQREFRDAALTRILGDGAVAGGTHGNNNV
jgi:hypothetical protein